MALPTREKAKELLFENVKDEYQRKHSEMVANAMEAYAKKFDEDNELWYITGLLHDLDYYKFPKEHPAKSIEWFKEWGYPEELIHAVESHAFMRTGTKPETKLAKAPIACDEMSGLLYAYSLMRPTGFQGMEAKSVKKKFKDKAFASKIDRSDIQFGMDQLGVEFSDHVDLLISTFSSDVSNRLVR